MLQSLHHKHYLFTPLDNAPAVTSEMPPVIPPSEPTTSHPFWPTVGLSDSPLVSHPHVPDFKTSGILKCLLTKTFWGLMHSVTNLRPQVGHHPTIRVLSTNMIRLQRWIQELAHTHTLQSMDLWIHIHKWRFSKWTGLPSKHLNIPPQKRRLKHEKLTLVSLTHLFISTQLCSHQVKLTFFKAFLHTCIQIHHIPYSGKPSLVQNFTKCFCWFCQDWQQWQITVLYCVFPKHLTKVNGRLTVIIHH